MAGGPPPAGGFRASLTRAAARLITPFGYLGVLGGLQVGLLWVLRGRYGVWLALIATIGLIALLGLLLTTTHHWRLKLWGVAWLGALDHYVGLGLVRRDIDLSRPVIAAGAPARAADLPMRLAS